MSFLRGTTGIEGSLYHHTGTKLEFSRSLAPRLPTTDRSVDLVMPDGSALVAHFTSTAAYPYLVGPELVRWIKSWLAFRQRVKVILTESPSGTVTVTLTGVPSAVIPVVAKDGVRRSVMRLGKLGVRTKKGYERWERNPKLREVVLSVWPAACQVDGCDLATRGAGPHAGRVVDVHHLLSVSKDGSDSPLNLCVLCVIHHVLIHRTPGTVIERSNLRSVAFRVDGLRLNVTRDVLALMRAIAR